MRKTNTITAEIVELQAIKAAYNHYLASHNAQYEVENATMVRANRAIVSINLKELYRKLHSSGKAVPVRQDANAIKPADTNTLRMKFATYPTTELEDRAIMHFNSDRRYTITE